MSANTNYFIWRFFGILLYPLYATWCHFRFRKRVYHLTCHVNDLANAYDPGSRGQIAHRIFTLLYCDYGDKDKRATFDFAAIAYLTKHAPWLAIRCNLESRKVMIATRQGDVLLCEEFDYHYKPDMEFVDKSFRQVNDRAIVATKSIREGNEVQKKTLALLVYFIMLNIMRRP